MGKSLKAILLFSVSFMFFLCQAKQTSMKKDIVVIGHRGACGYAPENTLASFKKAIELGVHAVELDVFKTKDNKLVVIHDQVLNRTTNGSGLVFEKTLQELKKLNAGNGETIPTLEEVLDCIDRRIKINIELKGQQVTALVAACIKKYVEEKKWSYDNFIVSSFNHYAVQKFTSLCPEVNVGALIDGPPLNYPNFALQLSADYIIMNATFVNDESVQKAHENGLKIFVFTVNCQDAIERMFRLGVDGIISNYPDRVFSFRKK